MPCIALALTTVSCQKDEEEAAPYIEPYTTHSYTIYDSASYTFDDLLLPITSSLDTFSDATQKLLIQTLISGALKNVEKNMPLASDKATVYKAYKYTYESVDQTGKPVTLSSLLVIPQKHTPAYGVLNFHYTIFADSECPTKSMPVNSFVVADNCLLVCPDGQGYGASRHLPPPYLNLTITAHNCIDAYLTALDIAKDKGYRLPSSFYTWLTGYSQGGSLSFAEHRYIETQLGNADRRRINLKWSYCGGGVYSPKETMRAYLENTSLTYIVCFPMVLAGEMYSYPEIFEGIKIEDYFTEDFVQSGLIEATNSKDYTVEELQEMYINFLHSRNPHSLLKTEIWDTTSRLYNAMMKAAEADEQTTGWQPKAKMVLYHTDADQMVPYSNSTIAYEALKQSGNVAPVVTIKGQDHPTTGLLFFLDIVNYGNEQKLYKHYWN